MEAYRGQLSHPIFTKTPKKRRNYNEGPGTSVNRSLQSPPPAAASGDRRRLQSPLSQGQRELHCQKALKRTAIDTHPRRRVRAVTERPSVGATPQAPSTMDASSLSTTTAAVDTRYRDIFLLIFTEVLFSCF